jgi:alpha-tubulin suppressor-like RCC1 family protein
MLSTVPSAMLRTALAENSPLDDGSPPRPLRAIAPTGGLKYLPVVLASLLFTSCLRPVCEMRTPYTGDPGSSACPESQLENPVPVGGPDGYTSADGGRLPRLTAGAYHNCVLLPDGGLWCWGDDSYGELGDGLAGPDQASSFPVAVTGDARYRLVSVGSFQSCGIRPDSSLWCWGLNLDGSLGDGTTEDRHTPVPIVPHAQWAQVSPGEFHGCGVRTDGTMWCWGRNDWGQLGLGDGGPDNRLVPTQVGSDSNWARVSASSVMTCALRVEGTLWCWGAIPNSSDCVWPCRNTPTQLAPQDTWLDLAAYSFGLCAVRADRTLWCGQFPAVSDVSDADSTFADYWLQFDPGSDWAFLGAGEIGSCATRVDGTLWCWGSISAGDGTFVERTKPTQVGSAHDWVHPAVGREHACASRADGAIWCWGDNTSGQLGDGTNATSLSPVQVRLPPQ